MGDQDDGDRFRLEDLGDGPVDVGLARSVQAGGVFIKEEDLGLANEGSSDADTLRRHNVKANSPGVKTTGDRMCTHVGQQNAGNTEERIKYETARNKEEDKHRGVCFEKRNEPAFVHPRATTCSLGYRIHGTERR